VFDAPTIFLLIFAISFVLTVVSFIMGIADFSFGGHGVGHGHVDAGQGLHLGDAPATPHAHVGDLNAHVGNGLHVDHAGHAPGDHGVGGEGISPFNMATILAFLTWFGGAGFLLTSYGTAGVLLTVVLSAAVGLVGAAIVFLFMVRVLLPGQTPYLSSDDYDMVGTIGRLTVGIREGGTGELVYSKGGTRHVASARTEDGNPIERGAEVVVVRHEGGIAYVELFAAFMESTAPSGARG
jgi:membrane protein implicated in regulation of membrane protease activity